MKILKSSLLASFIYMGVILCMFSCKSYIPDDMDALGDQIKFTKRDFTPIVGRTSFHEDLLSETNKSTLPLDIEILDIKDADGNSVKKLFTDKFPVHVWQSSYTGKETSLKEIEDKRTIEYRPAIELQKHSGDLVFWNTTSLLGLQTIPSDGYSMDVAIGNKGGSTIDRDLKLRFYKPRPYEPSEYDPNTGLARYSYLWPEPTDISNLIDEDQFGIYDIRINIIKNYDNKAPGSTLTISTVDSLYKPIDIKKFNNTNFETLVHGFNPRFDNGKVTYDVLYPMPIANIKTNYTNSDGTRSTLYLGYKRLDVLGRLSESYIKFNFAIYEEGHWEIRIRFAGSIPKFDND
ncbi:DUF5007 domain-containing protein [Sphingobacterium bovistauri]|uniref:DUF5007 domain-containing protein n=1 Tax=Sphingobacterium bovistauri TaxID=2781959 RepID=A0ABS7Z6Y7_9SPHI|nr:DUF5007 domain-containing protein [Sphingobacterium bovistauri]MCA5005915.1 DUF5007 domain-containing protein [Sphingobacterium bovistauri]